MAGLTSHSSMQTPGGQLCARARFWVSLRVDGELSELEGALLDAHLARVFAFLDETGQWDDTLIIFTCDHGEQLGDHHLLGKIG